MIKFLLSLFVFFIFSGIQYSGAQVAHVVGSCDSELLKNDRGDFTSQFKKIGSESAEIEGLYYSFARPFKDSRYGAYYIHRFYDDGRGGIFRSCG